MVTIEHANVLEGLLEGADQFGKFLDGQTGERQYFLGRGNQLAVAFPSHPAPRLLPGAVYHKSE